MNAEAGVRWTLDLVWTPWLCGGQGVQVPSSAAAAACLTDLEGNCYISTSLPLLWFLNYARDFVAVQSVSCICLLGTP